MNINIHDDLLSRRSFISEQLDKTQSKLNKISLTKQLLDINGRLAEIEKSQQYELAKAVVTFSGAPVDKSRGIQPIFASKVISAFSDILDSLLDASKTCTENMYITGTAMGSFGFVLEELHNTYSDHAQEQLNLPSNNEVIQSINKKALDQVIFFLKGADNDDDLLSESINEMDDKTLDKIRKFINTLSSYDALCSIKSNNHKFSFRDRDHLSRIEGNLIESNIIKTPIKLSGYFIGILPNDRVGEFQDTRGLIKVKIPKPIEIPQDIRDIVSKNIELDAIETSINGKKPTFSLNKQKITTLSNI